MKLLKGRWIKTKPVDIVVDPDVEKPEECMRPRPIPAHWQEEANQIIDNLLEVGLISKLEKSTGFLSPSFHVAKPGNAMTPRLVIDYSQVNQCMKHPGHCTQSTEEIIRQVGPRNKFWLALDQTQGCWQCGISEETRDVTAFITANHGKFIWNVLPMGMVNSLDDFIHITNGILEEAGMHHYIKILDDLPLHTKTLQVLCVALKKLLKICRENHISLNPQKLKFGSPERPPIKYGSVMIHESGITPDERKVKAITDMRQPANFSEVRCLLGLLSSIRRWFPELTCMKGEIRKLLPKRNYFLWTEAMELEFQTLKMSVTTEAVCVCVCCCQVV